MCRLGSDAYEKQFREFEPFRPAHLLQFTDQFDLMADGGSFFHARGPARNAIALIPCVLTVCHDGTLILS
jgi:hypothetical protein